MKRLIYLPIIILCIPVVLIVFTFIVGGLSMLQAKMTATFFMDNMIEGDFESAAQVISIAYKDNRVVEYPGISEDLRSKWIQNAKEFTSKYKIKEYESIEITVLDGVINAQINNVVMEHNGEEIKINMYLNGLVRNIHRLDQKYFGQIWFEDWFRDEEVSLDAIV